MKHNPFTKQGAEDFSRSALNDIFTALDNDTNPPNINITVGSHSIEIPSYAEVWELLELFLEKALEEEEEYNA